MSIRVLYLTMNYAMGGTTVPTAGWFRCLRKRGLRPVVAASLPSEFARWAESVGVPTYEVPMPLPTKGNPWPFAQSLWRLRRLVKKYDVQLIHCNEQNIYPTGRYLARLCRLPVVVSVHCAMNRGFTEWAFGGRRQPDRIFFISSGSFEVCRPVVEGVICPTRWRMLYNGLDLEHYQPCQERRARFRAQHGLGDAPLIGVACALREWKRLEHLIVAAAHLPVPGLRVVLAGGTVTEEKEYGDGLLAEARRTLGDKLLYLGHLTDLRDLFNGLDLFVNTSRQETCSISVLEALACGCPVVGYPSRSVDSQVLPGGGETVKQDDVDALVDCLNRWLADKNRLTSTRAGARLRVEQEFDIRTWSDRLWDEYTELLAHDRDVAAPQQARWSLAPSA